jgi:hypothetical protein
MERGSEDKWMEEASAAEKVTRASTKSGNFKTAILLPQLETSYFIPQRIK